VVDRGFESNQRLYKICICCFSAKHAALRRKSKDWLTRNQNNMCTWSDISTHRLLFQWVSTINIQLSVLFKYKVDIIIFSLNVAYSCCNLSFGNQHSLTITQWFPSTWLRDIHWWKISCLYHNGSSDLVYHCISMPGSLCTYTVDYMWLFIFNNQGLGFTSGHTDDFNWIQPALDYLQSIRMCVIKTCVL
jgi:hypothetical protein